MELIIAERNADFSFETKSQRELLIFHLKSVQLICFCCAYHQKRDTHIFLWWNIVTNPIIDAPVSPPLHYSDSGKLLASIVLLSST